MDILISPIGTGCGPVAPSPVSWTVYKPIMLVWSTVYLFFFFLSLAIRELRLATSHLDEWARSYSPVDKHTTRACAMTCSMAGGELGETQPMNDAACRLSNSTRSSWSHHVQASKSHQMPHSDGCPMVERRNSNARSGIGFLDPGDFGGEILLMNGFRDFLPIFGLRESFLFWSCVSNPTEIMGSHSAFCVVSWR